MPTQLTDEDICVCGHLVDNHDDYGCDEHSCACPFFEPVPIENLDG
jgi:hypothetical protein